MFWRGSGREQVICGGVSVTMQSLISFCGLLGIQPSPARCHFSCSGGLPSWNDQASATVWRKFSELWVELSPSLKSLGLIKFYWNCFSSHPFLQGQICAAMFSWVKNNKVFRLYRIKTFIFPAQQKDFYSKDTFDIFFWKWEHSNRKWNIDIIQILLFHSVATTMWCVWELFCNNKRLCFDKKNRLWIRHVCFFHFY